MKNIIALFILSTGAFASTVDSHSLPVLGTESNDSFSLNTTATRTEYRTETVERTCWRLEIIGYQTICDRLVAFDGPRGPGPGHDPGRGPGPGPRPMPPMPPRPPVCHQEPIFRNMPYACWETVRIPYEVVDHQTVSNFSVKMNNANNMVNVNQCSINFTVMGDNLSTGTNCLDYLAVAKSNLNTMFDHGTKIQNFAFDINLLDRNKILAPLSGGLTNLHHDNQNLVVVTGDLNVSKNYTLRLFVQRKRFLQADETLIDRALNPNEYVFENGLTKIDLQKLLGGINTSKKHDVRLQLDVALPAGNVLNTNLPSLHQEAKLTIWDGNN